MSYRETHDSLCVLLEEYADADIETIANQVLAMFGLLGEDLLESLDPPRGLQIWLRDHGLSLVTVTEARSPRVWKILEEDDDEEEGRGEPEEALEGEDQDDLPLQVGDYVEYRTSPHGPNRAMLIGAGRITEVGDNYYWLRTGDRDIYIEPDDGDIIQAVPVDPS